MVAKKTPVEKKKVLFAAFEAQPFMKTGGLGDVGGSLPAALAKAGAEVRVILPKFDGIPDRYKKKMEPLVDFLVPLGWRNQYCGIETLTLKGVTYYFIDNEYYFRRAYPYGYDDDAERIAFFSKAILEALQYLPDFFPDVIHCNDWHTALTPVFLREHYMALPEYRDIKTVFTIHNLKFQGQFPPSVLADVLGLHKNIAASNQLADNGCVNFMKGALLYSDRLTTVSETYSEEIQSEYYGEGMQYIFQSRRHILSGIVNGIDITKYNPAKDKSLYKAYTKETLEVRKENKADLQAELGLPKADVPVIAVVSRLAEQKGLDLVVHIMEDLMALPVQVAILGTGELKYENFFREFAQKYPEKVAAKITFDEKLAQKVYGSADLLLMPSQYEPCGISQILAMHYGALPVVRETGGLKDTVSPYNKYTGIGTGFSFQNFNAHELLNVIKDATNIYYNEPKVWQSLQKQAMEADFSWKASAKQYIELYESMF